MTIWYGCSTYDRIWLPHEPPLSPLSASILACSSWRLRSRSLACRTSIALALFCSCDALVLAGHDDAGREVGEAHGGVGGVDALTAGAGRAIDVDAELVLGDLDVVGLLDDRHDLDAGEGRLPAALVVERADPHEAVRALLDATAFRRRTAP